MKRFMKAVVVVVLVLAMSALVAYATTCGHQPAGVPADLQVVYRTYGPTISYCKIIDKYHVYHCSICGTIWDEVIQSTEYVYHQYNSLGECSVCGIH